MERKGRSDQKQGEPVIWTLFVSIGAAVFIAAPFALSTAQWRRIATRTDMIIVRLCRRALRGVEKRAHARIIKHALSHGRNPVASARNDGSRKSRL